MLAVLYYTSMTNLISKKLLLAAPLALLAAAFLGVLLYLLINPDPLGTKPLIINDQYIGETIWVEKVAVDRPSLLLISSITTSPSDEQIGRTQALDPGLYQGLEAGVMGEGDNLIPGLYSAALYEDVDRNEQLDEQIDTLMVNKKGVPIVAIFRLK